MYSERTPNLTPRELEILRLVSLGCKDCQIAERLYIETNTVKTHMNRIFPKLLVNTRTEAVVKAIAKGLIDCPCSSPLSHGKETTT